MVLPDADGRGWAQAGAGLTGTLGAGQHGHHGIVDVSAAASHMGAATATAGGDQGESGGGGGGDDGGYVVRPMVHVKDLDPRSVKTLWGNFSLGNTNQLIRMRWVGGDVRLGMRQGL